MIQGHPSSNGMSPIDFYWHQYRICHHFWNIWRGILMTLN